MALTKVLITVKTYPTLASKYDELVCTAGFREDGSWIRIYPIPFRKLEFDNRYKKYDWIECDLVRNTSDFRAESYRPKSLNNPPRVVGHIDTKGNWFHRKQIVLPNAYHSYEQLLMDSKDQSKITSLAVYKPREILDFIIEPVEREWDAKKLAKLEARASQMNMFDKSDNPFKVVNKLPYKFSFVFCDENGKERTMMIEDWETGQLFWRCLQQHDGDEEKACWDVRRKYYDDFALTKDLYFYMGTTLIHHIKNAPNPFVIIGTFQPKIDQQYTLF